MLAYGVSLVREKRLDEAAPYVERVQEIDPTNTTAALMAAQIGVRGGNSEYAEANYHKALQADPRNMRALMGLARLHNQNKKPEAAIEVLKTAVEVDPQSARVRRQLAALLRQNSQADEAKAQLEHALAANPSDRGTAVQLANVCMRDGDKAEAISILEKALEGQPGNRRLTMSLGRMKLRAEDYEGAETVLRPLASSERGALARIALVQSLIPQHKLSEARSLLARSSRGSKTSSLVHRLYGDAFVEEEKWESAEQSYRAGVAAMRQGGDELLAEIDAAKAANPGASGAALIQIYKDVFAAKRAEQVAARKDEDPRARRLARRAKRQENREGPNATRRQQVLQRLAQQRNGNNANGQAQGGGLRARIQERRAQQQNGSAAQGDGAAVTGEVLPPQGQGRRRNGGLMRNIIQRRRGNSAPQA